MILTEPALDSVAHVHEVILLLPWRGKIAPAEVFEQGLKPASRLFQILGRTAQPFQLVEVSIQVSF
jgi:hypothetical protein